jgi:hypothetical protein
MAAVSIPPQRLAVTTHHRVPTHLLYDIALPCTYIYSSHFHSCLRSAIDTNLKEDVRIASCRYGWWRDPVFSVRCVSSLANMTINARCADASLFAGQLGKDSSPSLPHVLRNIAKESGSGSDKNVERGAGAMPERDILWVFASCLIVVTASVLRLRLLSKIQVFGTTPAICTWPDPWSLGLWLRWDNYFLGREEFLIGYSVRFWSGTGFHSLQSPSLDAFHIQNTVVRVMPCGKGEL